MTDNDHLAEFSGPLLALLSFLAYWASFKINALVMPWTEYTPGVSFVFIPAGVKLAALLVAGGWGLLGLAAAALWMAAEVWAQSGVGELLGNIAVWLGVPFLVVELMLKLLRVERDLRNLTFWKMLITGTAATAAGSFASSAYAVSVHGRSEAEWMASALAMLLGDLVGAGLVVLLGMATLHALHRVRARRQDR